MFAEWENQFIEVECVYKKNCLLIYIHVGDEHRFGQGVKLLSAMVIDAQNPTITGKKSNILDRWKVV